MSRVVTSVEVGSETEADPFLQPRDGLVLERAVAPGRFEAVEGPLQGFRRSVEVEPLEGGRLRVNQSVDYRLDLPFVGWLFAWPVRRSLVRGPPGMPWWAPPQRVDARGARALAGRTYGREGRLILELEDGFCDWNAGRWELEGATEGATCRPSEAEPDLVLGAGELASIYLGAIRPSVLAEAGRLAELTDGSLHRADAMFATDLAPWCAHIF